MTGSKSTQKPQASSKATSSPYKLTKPAKSGIELSESQLDRASGGAVFPSSPAALKLELKIDVFRQIEAVVGPDCVLASDTSGIPITKIQEGLSLPGRVVGMPTGARGKARIDARRRD